MKVPEIRCLELFCDRQSEMISETIFRHAGLVVVAIAEGLTIIYKPWLIVIVPLSSFPHPRDFFDISH